MKALIIASLTAATLALGTFGANAASVSGQQERANDFASVAHSQAAPIGSYAGATTSDTVSGQQERANDVWSVIHSQPSL